MAIDFDEDEATVPDAALPVAGPPHPPASYERARAEAAADLALRLEQRVVELTIERDQLAAALEEAEERAGKLVAEVLHLRAKIKT